MLCEGNDLQVLRTWRGIWKGQADLEKDTVCRNRTKCLRFLAQTLTDTSTYEKTLRH